MSRRRLTPFLVWPSSIMVCATLGGCATGITSTATSTPSVIASAQSAVNWQPPSIGSINQLGSISFSGSAQATLLRPVLAPLNGMTLTLTTITSNATNTASTLTYSFPGGTVHLKLATTLTSSGITLTLDADQPIIASVDAGAFDSQLQLQSIAVPFYSRSLFYSQSISQFLNVWWDWQQTSATTLPAISAQYGQKTDGTLNLLHEQLHVAVSPTVADVFPAIPNPASPYKTLLSGRLVLDSWDSSFSVTQQGLSDLGDYGIGHCALILHNWQHFGYDNALPQHYSANPAIGGDDGLLAAVTTAKADDCLAVLHENYTDYYPDFPAFNQASIALNSSGVPIDSWLNPVTNIQSFLTKPSWMVNNAQSQSPVIHQRYGTGGSYLDVNSAVTPDARSDMDAAQPAAGTVGLWFSNATALWAFERQAHAGPVFGEGANHWYYSGLLDGVEAQLGAGQTSMNIGESLPLFVDFDLLRIHPLQVNHGMGYFERWSKTGSANLSTLETDAYRMQEIAFGHAPFLGRATWSNVPQALIEDGLMAPAATSYGTALATTIQYASSTGWVDASVAARTNAFAQVQVTYDNGLAIAANSAATPLAWNGLILPQYGWVAKGSSILAYTAQCGDSLCDYSETPTTLFANSRNQADARTGWNYAAPSVATFTQPTSGDISVTYLWQVLRQFSPDIAYRAFVHFVDDSQVTATSEGIVFQADHLPSTPTAQWRPGTAVGDGPVSTLLPSSLPDGTYSIRIGLYDPTTGNRVSLAGLADATARILIGYITVSNQGAKIVFSPPPAPPDDPRLNALDTIVDFGKIKTDGMVSLQEIGSDWVLRPFPRTRNVTILLDKSAFPMPALITDGTTSTAPIDSGNYWQVPVDGAKSYSWPVH